MKRFLTLLMCLLVLVSMAALPVSAAETAGEQIALSQSVEDLGDGCYYVETIYVPAVQTYSSEKVGTKVAQYIASGTTIYTISVTGTFSYDGSSAEATSASGTIALYVEGATIISRNAYTSGASAYASGTVKYNGATLSKTVKLTCDKNGNLS